MIHVINKLNACDLVGMFDGLDSWRKPERILQLGLVSEADARGRGGLETQAYPQGIYLRQSYEVAKAVAVKSIIEQGFQGAQIREELTKQRIHAVEEWIKNQQVMVQR